MCDSLLPTLWVCESSAKLRKNVIGGSMLDNVFQHILALISSARL